ncbi:unnamed protein product, partial [marine sediment metagenome]
KLFGSGWSKYHEFKNIYGGVLSPKELREVINQSKISLCFSKNNYGKPHIIGKFSEVGACKTFVLTEYCEDYLDLFEEGKEIIMFKTKEELLEKIKYYLKNEKEREKIAEATYKKIINNYSLNIQLKKIFKEISKNNNFYHKELPKLNKKIIILSKKDLFLNSDELKNKLEKYDYISFSEGKHQNLKYKKYLQSYSLEKSGKSISCCDYFVYSKILGDYLSFFTDRG